MSNILSPLLLAGSLGLSSAPDLSTSQLPTPFPSGVESQLFAQDHPPFPVTELRADLERIPREYDPLGDRSNPHLESILFEIFTLEAQLTRQLGLPEGMKVSLIGDHYFVKTVAPSILEFRIQSTTVPKLSFPAMLSTDGEYLQVGGVAFVTSEPTSDFISSYKNAEEALGTSLLPRVLEQVASQISQAGPPITDTFSVLRPADLHLYGADHDSARIYMDTCFVADHLVLEITSRIHIPAEDLNLPRRPDGSVGDVALTPVGDRVIGTPTHNEGLGEIFEHVERATAPFAALYSGSRREVRVWNSLDGPGLKILAHGKGLPDLFLEATPSSQSEGGYLFQPAASGSLSFDTSTLSSFLDTLSALNQRGEVVTHLGVVKGGGLSEASSVAKVLFVAALRDNVSSSTLLVIDPETNRTEAYTNCGPPEEYSGSSVGATRIDLHSQPSSSLIPMKAILFDRGQMDCDASWIRKPGLVLIGEGPTYTRGDHLYSGPPSVYLSPR